MYILYIYIYVYLFFLYTYIYKCSCPSPSSRHELRLSPTSATTGTLCTASWTNKATATSVTRKLDTISAPPTRSPARTPQGG